MFCSCLCDVLCLSTLSSFDMCWFGSVCTRKFFWSVIVNGFCMYLRFPVHYFLMQIHAFVASPPLLKTSFLIKFPQIIPQIEKIKIKINYSQIYNDTYNNEYSSSLQKSIFFRLRPQWRKQGNNMKKAGGSEMY